MAEELETKDVEMVDVSEDTSTIDQDILTLDGGCFPHPFFS